MSNIILFDDDYRHRFLPLAFTRPIGDFRVGILTIREKWEKWLQGNVSYITQDYLSERFPIEIDDDNFIINSRALPSAQLCSLVRQMGTNEALLWKEELIAARLDRKQFNRLINDEEFEDLQGFDIEGISFLQIQQLTDLFRLNEEALRLDFEILTNDRISEPVTISNWINGEGKIFVEEGAKIECATLNATTGPIYIGKNAEIMEGCTVRGPFALCENATLKMGTKVYGATTVGPNSVIAGEIKNTVIFGNSNKGHEGYLGDSVIGEWCNLGADTNNSNLKNNYQDVRQWSYVNDEFADTGLMKCGLVMGDHSRCGINTMFNTGTVVGVSANIFGGGFPVKFVPSFAWGNGNFETYELAKALDTAAKVMENKGVEFNVLDRLILMRVFEDTAKYRRWE